MINADLALFFVVIALLAATGCVIIWGSEQ